MSEVDSLQPRDTTSVLALQQDDVGVNLLVKVLSRTMSIETTLPNGQPLVFAEFLVGDNTASIALIAKDDQINQCEIGKVISIQGARCEGIQGGLQLRLGKWTKLEVVSSVDLVPNVEINRSRQEWLLTG